MTRTAATASAFAFNGGGSGKRSSGSSFTVAFLLVATVVLADVIGFGECRSFLEDRQQLQRDRRDVGDGFDVQDYVSDGAGDDDDDSESETGGGDKNPPSILTAPLNVEAAEGTTVQLPCKVSEGSLDEVALIWINGSKSIMTDAFPTSTDPRVKPGPSSAAASSSGPSDHTLIIEQVSRWDSGQYTCRITSSPFVQITHTLSVSHMNPATIQSIQSAGASGPLNTGTKKLVVKQGDPVQLICNVAGHPTPTVQWTKRAKHHQNSTKHAAAASAGQEQNPVVQQQPMPTVVSNTNEVRIESVSAHQHAGFYECLARNSADESVVARSGIDLEVEYQPEVTVPRSVVNTGETYTAQLHCVVHSHPKPKVTWEKETAPNGAWEPVVADGSNPNIRYDAYKVTNAAAAAAAAGTQFTGNGSVPPVFALKVKRVQGPQDFGNYRCNAENKLGTTHSTSILLTGTPARPRSTYVKPSDAAGLTKTPELGWTVDSWSPLLEYQLQYKKQEDSSWTLVRPQPPVTESVANNAGDERKYTMSYVFGADGHQSAADAVPSSLEQGTTYVARLRARNVHGWSDWSTDVVLSGGMNDGQGTNEINHRLDDSNNVSKAVVGGTSGASDPRQSRSVVATTVFLAAAAAMAVAKAVC